MAQATAPGTPVEPLIPELAEGHYEQIRPSERESACKLQLPGANSKTPVITGPEILAQQTS